MSRSLRVVYMAHQLSAPTSEGIEANRRAASKWCAWALTVHGVSPSCSWIVLTGELPETPENRALGLEADKAQVARCDEVWLVGPRVSEGMRIESDHARALGIPVVDKTGQALPPVDRERDTMPAPRTEAVTLPEIRLEHDPRFAQCVKCLAAFPGHGRVCGPCRRKEQGAR